MTGHLDLNSSWGPFSQTYLGISHILNPAQGSMADLAIHVGRREPGSIILPDNTFDYTQDVEGGNRRAATRAMPESVAPTTLRMRSVAFSMLMGIRRSRSLPLKKRNKPGARSRLKTHPMKVASIFVVWDLRPSIHGSGCD